MSLLKFLEDPLDYWRPSLLSNQRFGLGLDDDDLLTAATIVPRKIRRLLNCPYYRSWNSRESQRDAGSLVSAKNHEFQVNLDVQQFAPEEISVKACGENTIIVEGKHEEKEDEHGFISRQFVRKYTIPQGHDINKVVTKLSSDGVLTISAPKIETEKEKDTREIPIQQTGVPSVVHKRQSEEKEDGTVSQMDISEKENPRIKKKKSN